LDGIVILLNFGLLNRPGMSGDSNPWKGWDGVMQGRRGGYPAELRERAVRLVAESRAHHDSEWAAITSVAAKLGVGCAETVRKWVRQVQVDSGSRGRRPRNRLSSIG
jgi:transposase